MARGGGDGKPGDIGEITVLKSQPRSEDALALLKKIASVSRPHCNRCGLLAYILSVDGETLCMEGTAGGRRARLTPADARSGARLTS